MFAPIMKMVFIGHYEHEESATCVMTSTRRIAKGRLVYHIFFKKVLEFQIMSLYLQCINSLIHYNK